MTDRINGAASRRPRLAIAGAGGFIGTALCQALADSFELFALIRPNSPQPTARPGGTLIRRECDLFSVDNARAALDGIDYAIYLIHSLISPSRLTQATAADMDLILADNFAQAARERGVKQIIVIGGLIPRGLHISRLLWSRREVEMVLAARGTPVTALRVALVVGPGSAGAEMLVDLVRRLPIIPLPRAARSVTRPIALDDLVRAIRHCIGQPERWRGHFDLGGADCMSYQAMLDETAALLGRRRWIFTTPLLTAGLAARVAPTVCRVHPSLVAPIIESLPQDTILRDNPLQQRIARDAKRFGEALSLLLAESPRRSSPGRKHPTRNPNRTSIKKAGLVRSIQRIILPPGQDAAWIAGNYFRWLERTLWPFVVATCDQEGSWTLSLRAPRLRLLFLRRLADQETPYRRVYRIAGGLLSRPDAPDSARFEFQTLLDERYTMAAIHDFAPALPWSIYRWTQAPTHRWIMHRYQRHLARLAR